MRIWLIKDLGIYLYHQVNIIGAFDYFPLICRSFANGFSLKSNIKQNK